MAFNGKHHKKLSFDPNNKPAYLTLKEKKELQNKVRVAKKCLKCIHNFEGYCNHHKRWANVVNSKCSKSNKSEISDTSSKKLDRNKGEINVQVSKK